MDDFYGWLLWMTFMDDFYGWLLWMAFMSWFFITFLNKAMVTSLLLGNMSNPCINRWGLNLFWYRYWYTDKIAPLNVQQDDIFSNLVYSYLFFGLLYPQNIFLNKYWYGIKFNSPLFNQKLYNEKYYRYVEIKNLFSQEKANFRLRSETKQIYVSKIWILRYQNWLIINFYNFQSLKKFKVQRMKLLDKNSIFLTPTTNLFNLKRVKLFLITTIINLKPILTQTYRF